MSIFHCHSCDAEDPCILTIKNEQDLELPKRCPFRCEITDAEWTRWLDEETA